MKFEVAKLRLGSVPLDRASFMLWYFAWLLDSLDRMASTPSDFRGFSLVVYGSSGRLAFESPKSAISGPKIVAAKKIIAGPQNY